MSNNAIPDYSWVGTLAACLMFVGIFGAWAWWEWASPCDWHLADTVQEIPARCLKDYVR